MKITLSTEHASHVLGNLSAFWQYYFNVPCPHTVPKIERALSALLMQHPSIALAIIRGPTDLESVAFLAAHLESPKDAQGWIKTSGIVETWAKMRGVKL